MLCLFVWTFFCPPALKDDIKQIPVIPGFSSGTGTMIYAGSVGTQIANELIDSYRYSLSNLCVKKGSMNLKSCCFSSQKGVIFSDRCSNKSEHLVQKLPEWAWKPVCDKSNVFWFFWQGELISIERSFESVWPSPGEMSTGVPTNQQECKWPKSEDRPLSYCY